MNIGPDTLEQIEAGEKHFCDFFGRYAEEVLQAARLYPKLSKLRLVEVHGAWVNDLTRVGTHEPMLMEGLDHFKRAGHLAFWIRRCAPMVEAYDLTDNLGDPEGYPLTTDEASFRDLLFGYANEYLAFDVGFQFCKYYETGKPGGSMRAANLDIGRDYIGMMCQFLKYKTVSPHAMAVIYRSLFL